MAKSLCKSKMDVALSNLPKITGVSLSPKGSLKKDWGVEGERMLFEKGDCLSNDLIRLALIH